MSRLALRELVANLFSQGLNSISSFVLVTVLAFILAPLEYGKFAAGWLVYLVGVSLCRAAVAEVYINIPAEANLGQYGALRAALIVNSFVSVLTGVISTLFLGTIVSGFAIALAVFFASFQDFVRFLLLKQSKGVLLGYLEFCNFALIATVAASAFLGFSKSGSQVWVHFMLATMVGAVIFASQLRGHWARQLIPGWLKSQAKKGFAFAVDALIGACFNLWQGAMIISILSFDQLGSYRFLVSYFGVSSLLANFAKSGFTAVYSAQGRRLSYLAALGGAMFIAPLTQWLLLFFGVGPLVGSFPVIASALPFALAAGSARFIASVSTISVVIARTRQLSAWNLTWVRALALVPGFALTSLLYRDFGLVGVLLVDILNYALLSVLPLFVIKNKGSVLGAQAQD